MTELTQLEQALDATSIGKWKSYPAYRDSGIEWLGEIPEHWEVRRLKFVTSFITSGSRGWAQYYRDEGDIFLRIGNLSRTSIRLDLGDIQHVEPPPGTEGERTRIKQNDVLISITAYIGSIGVVLDDLGDTYVNQHIALTRPRRNIVDSRWMGQCLLSRVGQDQFQMLLNGGTKDGLNLDDVGNLRIIVPPLSEQKSIADYLDQETARIDALIAKKQRLIELLQEKRAALISHAVSKGLDPDVKMKDSGVEWLGEIPAHWEVYQLRRIVNTFVDYRGFTPTKTSHGIPLITARNIRNGTLDFTNSQEFISEEDYDTRMVRGFPKSGDVLITTEAPLGETAQIIDENVTLAQRIILLKVDKLRMTNDCLKYYFISSSGQGELWSRATGSTAIGIKASHLKEVMIVVPPLVEQQAMTSFLDQETTKIDALISKIGEAIEKLKEYSAALISAAVMGKIDVRDEVTISDEMNL